MRKTILTLFLLCGLFVETKTQEMICEDRVLFVNFQMEFISKWLYFRMQKNPLLTCEETHTQWGEWKHPDKTGIFPDTFFTKDYQPDIKVHTWEKIYKRPKNPYYEQIQTPFLYVIEKGNGITGIRKKRWTDEILDTVQINCYDSIFPYDNRFLIKHNPYETPRKFLFYSGNVSWEPLYKTYISEAGFMRGVQFGVEHVKELKREMMDSVRKLRPEYPDYVYATADESFLSKRPILIAGPENRISDYIEYIFYTDDTIKTGGDKYDFYEIRYVLPTVVKSISERRMIKRKLTEEEKKVVGSSYLSLFVEDYAGFWGLRDEVEDE